MLDARSYASKVQSAYGPSAKRLRALIIGNKGTGKTSLLRTARKPILLDMFDPGGEQVLDDLIASGDCLVCDYSGGKAADFDRWRQDVEERKACNFYSQIGTYAIDSITTWSETLIDAILDEVIGKPQKGGVHGDKMELQDWGTLLDWVGRYSKEMLTYPTDVIALGHIKKTQDGLSGKLIYDVMIQGSSDERLPVYFSEAFTLINEAKGETIERYLITRNDGMYKCSTRLGKPDEKGNHRFDLHEKPDIKHLLAKAGLSTDDLPPLID